MTVIKSNTQAAKKNTFSAETTEGIFFKNKEHQRIYDAFLYILETKKESNTLNLSKEKVCTFLCDNLDDILKGVDLEEIEPLSEENFYQFLLSILKKIKSGNLANEENLKNGKIQELVNKCISNARGTEVRDSFIRLLGVPIRVKIDPKNFCSSFKRGILNKIPLFGSKEEEHEPPKSDTELITDALAKVFLPIFLFVVTASLLVVSPTMVVFGVIGLVFATSRAISSLFANDKEGTLYNPLNTLKDQSKNWDRKISNDVDKILHGIEKGQEQNKKWAGEILESRGSAESQNGTEKNQEQRSWVGEALKSNDPVIPKRS